MNKVVLSSTVALGLVLSAGTSLADSTAAALARMEAKLEALAKENKVLRGRLDKLAPRVASITPTTATDASPPPAAGTVKMSGPVYAANFPVKAAPVAVRPACGQFGGGYVGGHGGWGYYTHNHHDRDFMPATVSADLPASVRLQDDNWHAGVQGGYNWQRGCTVFGVEADWSWSGMKAFGSFNDGGAGAALDTLSVESQMQWFGTVRARTGVVVDDLLLYVTGGFAYADFDRVYTITEGAPLTTARFTSSDVRWGWTAGVGTEWRWTNNWSVKSEFLYLRFVDETYTIPGTVIGGIAFGAAGSNNRINVQDDAWVTRIGINYRWN
jgi:outer membrane immunogenic protein